MTSPPVETDTRTRILHALLEHKRSGLTLDELADRLDISRNAVRQHVSILERDGLVEVAGRRTATGGRPSRAYGLTAAGMERFPRQYDMLAEGMIATLSDQLGDTALDSILARLARHIAEGRREELAALPEEERKRAIIALMNELGYDARLQPDGTIAAFNCVFHKIAAKTRAVCRYDEKLLTALLGSDVKLVGCIQDGDNTCTFARIDTDAGERA